VRATEHAQRGSFMLEYAGEIIDELELAARMDAARVAGACVIVCLGVAYVFEVMDEPELADRMDSVRIVGACVII